jgi:hypothetical protein
MIEIHNPSASAGQIVLGSSQFLTGSMLTMADVQMSFPLEVSAAQGMLGCEVRRGKISLAKIAKNAKKNYQEERTGQQLCFTLPPNSLDTGCWF